VAESGFAKLNSCGHSRQPHSKLRKIHEIVMDFESAETFKEFGIVHI